MNNQQASAETQLNPVVRLSDVRLTYGKTHAIDGITLDLPAGCMVGLIGPDGVGKSSVLSLIAGARRIQQGQVEALGGDMADANFRRVICPRIAYMPQGLGKNLYPTLSVFENVDFFARLFGQGHAERKRRIAELLDSIGLGPFPDRPAGKLSGGMKQKLCLCCALIHDPDLLILDEPTTGVDPLSRRQFWELVDRIRGNRPGMSVLVATAYMEEAARFDFLVAMDEGRVLATGTPAELLARTGARDLDSAFIALLPEEKRAGHKELVIPPRPAGEKEVVIEAEGLTQRFGTFTAVDHVDFKIERGEIYGFLGANGCGKSTTMKMLCGLLTPTEGQAWLFGESVDGNDINVRRKVGYMSQAFSLYSELSVRQNLVLHAQLFDVPRAEIPDRVAETAERFGLGEIMDVLPDALPLGQRQRLQLAVALIHRPQLLILDEPTSGVDPVARDGFWEHLIDLSRRDKVTIFVSTHFINEAGRCDRISLMSAGKVLVIDTPDGVVKQRGAASLEDAFIGYLEEADNKNRAAQVAAASGNKEIEPHDSVTHSIAEATPHPFSVSSSWFSPQRLLACSYRELMELTRDPIRMTLAGVGSVILMIIMGYGITLDVEHLNYAVLDRDQTTTSRDYLINIKGASRYFRERPPVSDYDDIDRRMRSGELSMVVEIPSGFGRNVGRGLNGALALATPGMQTSVSADVGQIKPVEIGIWIDGAMPQRAETIRGYVQGMHLRWLQDVARYQFGLRENIAPANIELRYRYNPDVKSLVAMVPAVIPLLLLLIPAMLATLSVVREKDLGSIINFYVTPTTRLEFLLGKQLPYVVLGFLNFLLLVALAVTLFRVPMKGNFPTAAAGALLYVGCSTGIGLLISTLTRTQVAALFATAVLTLVPASNFCGLTDPVSSLEGFCRVVGELYPTAYYITISRGTFNKALGFGGLYQSFIPLLIAIPVLIGLSAAFLKKQES